MGKTSQKGQGPPRAVEPMMMMMMMNAGTIEGLGAAGGSNWSAEECMSQIMLHSSELPELRFYRAQLGTRGIVPVSSTGGQVTRSLHSVRSSPLTEDQNCAAALCYVMYLK